MIALFDADDAHHEKAAGLLEAHIDEAMTIGPVKLAEVLGQAVREGRLEEMLANIRALGITMTPSPTTPVAVWPGCVRKPQ